MEALSRAYVEAIVGYAGYSASIRDYDRDSIDLEVHAGDAMRPAIGIQLKATMRFGKNLSNFSFALPVKNYNDLRVPTQTPRILVLLALPRREASWLNQNVNRLILRRGVYWKSLSGMPATKNTESVSIDIDISKVFDVPTLVGLMQKSRNGQAL